MGTDATLAVAAAPTATPAGSAQKSSDWDFSFHNLLDIINPLEHLPIIGTLYRAITGTHIGIPEKIAGDALYGGLWGAVSSVADAAFEAVTGKDFGSTVLALFTGHHHDTAVAAVTVWSAGPGKPGLLEPMGVHRDHRGHGYGRAITVAAAAALQKLGSSSATVCTRVSNVGGVATYEAAGFTRLPERRDRYRDA